MKKYISEVYDHTLKNDNFKIIEVIVATLMATRDYDAYRFTDKIPPVHSKHIHNRITFAIENADSRWYFDKDFAIALIVYKKMYME